MREPASFLRTSQEQFFVNVYKTYLLPTNCSCQINPCTGHQEEAALFFRSNQKDNRNELQTSRSLIICRHIVFRLSTIDRFTTLLSRWWMGDYKRELLRTRVPMGSPRLLVFTAPDRSSFYGRRAPPPEDGPKGFSQSRGSGITISRKRPQWVFREYTRSQKVVCFIEIQDLDYKYNVQKKIL